ncbi:hypothetical protein BJ741DRAFT_584614 [Chytriomyces cf. hyalinus JEL632]|nr:hypothetical protein BJ741DRAFT_584614 [Chytriomyces cf. hyalinus JEL632]
MPVPQDPNPSKPKTCEENMQKIIMTTPNWSGESVTFIDPNWATMLTLLLADEYNNFKPGPKGIPIDILAPADRKYQYTIEYTGGFQFPSCTWETTSLLTVVMLSNLEASAKKVEVFIAPAEVTCNFNFNQGNSLGNSTAASASPPVVYRKLENAGINSECSTTSTHVTPCGEISDCCECSTPATKVTGWQVSTEGFIRAGSKTYHGAPIDQQVFIKSTKACDNFASDALDFLFELSDAFLPFLPFKNGKQRDKINNIMSGA